jgi:hypothetical protein
LGVRLGRPIALAVPATVIAIALLCAPSLASPGKVFEVGRDKGLPLAYAKGTAESPAAMFVRIRAKPSRKVEVSYDTNCSKHHKARIREGFVKLGANKVRRLKMGYKRPAECLVNAVAGYVDTETEGTLKIELLARG